MLWKQQAFFFLKTAMLGEVIQKEVLNTATHSVLSYFFYFVSIAERSLDAW